MKRIGTFLILLLALLGLHPAQAQTCAAPTNVSVASAGSPGNNTAVVSFTPSATAVSYTVRYFWVGDSTAAGQLSVNTATSPITLTGLRTGTGAYYRVKVVSNCAGGSTAASGWLLFQVGGSGGPGAGSCGTVTGVFGSGSLSTATLGFTPVAGAVSYTIRYHAVGDTIWHTSIITGSSLTLTGLAPGTNFVATIVTNCANGAASTGVNATFGSATAPNVCGTVSNVQVSAITDSTAIITFTPVAGATSYVVRVVPGGVGGQFNATVTGSPVRVTGLSPGRAYTVDITTNCAGGGTSAIVRSSFFTANTNPVVCGTVTNVTVTGTSSSTATLSFTPGAGNIRYSVYYYSRPDSMWVNTNASPVTLTGLVPGRTYTIRVVGYCGTGANVTATTNTPITFSFRGALAARAALGAGAVELFPNPAHHAATLVLPAVPGAATARLTLLNALGQQVRTQAAALNRTGETRAQLDLADVPPGLYTLRVAAGGQTASQRLAVE